MSWVVAAGDAPAWASDLARQINSAFDRFPVVPRQFTVATAPSASAFKNHIGVCTNGNAGARCLCVSDGTNWKVLAFGSNIAVS